MFWPLLVYAGLTLVSAAFSPQRQTSFIDCKQLVLFLLVPVTYRLMNESRAQTLVSVVMSLGAVSAVYGIIQYGILHYDTLGQRPQGTLSHYMTYSGLLMLVIGIALARVLFGRRERVWAVLVMPALLVAISLTQSRNAWMGVHGRGGAAALAQGLPAARGAAACRRRSSSASRRRGSCRSSTGTTRRAAIGSR